MEQQQKITADRSKPFGWSDKIGYAFGDAGNNFTFSLIASFFMIFLTNILGISAAIVAGLMLFARLVDAIADITVGRLVDVSKLHKGDRFKPWIRRFQYPLAIGAILLFTPWVNTWAMGARVVWVAVIYILWGVLYSCVNIPYGSLSAAMSDDANEKTTLSTWRSVGASSASLLLSFVLPLVVYVAGTKKLNEVNFFLTVVVCAIFAVICYNLTLHFTTERITVEREKALPMSKLLKDMVHNKALLALVLADLIFVLWQNLNGISMTYLFTYYFGNIPALAVLLLVNSLILISVAPFVSYLVNHFGRKESTMVGFAWAFLMYGILFLIHTHSLAVYMTFNFLGMYGLAIFNIMVWAFINDVIDNQQVITGIREVGSIYAVNSFSRKVSQAIAGSFGASMFAIVGFVSSTTGGANQSQGTINGIYNIATAVPTFVALAAFLVMAFLYPLNKKKVNENVEALRESVETVSE